MNDDYKKLYETQDELSKQLQKTIDIKNKIIKSVETENELLKKENEHLKKENQLLTQICEEQQEWVRKFLGK